MFVTVQSVKKKNQDLPNSEALSLIIKRRFAQVPPQELKHTGLPFSQELYSIISAFLSAINLAVLLEYFFFLLPLTFSKFSIQTRLSKLYALKESNWLQINLEVTVWPALCQAVWHSVRVLHDPFYSMKPIRWHWGLPRLLHCSNLSQLEVTSSEVYWECSIIAWTWMWSCSRDSPTEPGPMVRVTHPILVLDPSFCLGVHRKSLKPLKVQPCWYSPVQILLWMK